MKKMKKKKKNVEKILNRYSKAAYPSNFYDFTKLFFAKKGKILYCPMDFRHLFNYLLTHIYKVAFC